MRKVLQLPVYRRLLAAYALNELAWSVGTLALSVLVYRRTGSAYGSTAFFLCSLVLPALFSPLFVAQIDQRAPRRVLPALYALEAVLFAGLALLTSRFSLVPVLALALADGIVASAARALARTATVAVLAPTDLLHEGNALANGAFSICFMIGPALGGAVVVAGGTVAALLVNCAIFGAIAVVLVTATLPGPPPERETTSRRLRAALVHVRENRPVLALLVLQAVGLVFFTISVPVEVVFAQHSLHAGPGGYGALLSAWGAGAVVGSAAYARWSRRGARVLIAASAGSLGVGFAVMAAAPSLAVALIGSALGGLSNGVEMVAARTAIQERVAEQWMALVMSLNESVAQAAPGLGFLLGGTITALADPRAALAVAAAGSFAVMVVVWLALRPARFGPAPGPGAPPGRRSAPGPGSPPARARAGNAGPEVPASGRETLV